MPRLVLDIYHGERGIDLAAWKAKHDLWGVIVKCGGSDDDYWDRFEETTYVQQYTQAKGLGLRVGAYYYSDALTSIDALVDAKHCVNDCLRGLPLDLPVYLDIEERSQLDMPMHALTDVVTTFCDYVRRAGYEVGVYSNYYGFHNMFEDRISSYSLWAAAWRTSWPIWAKDYDLWQEGSMDLAGNRYHDEDDVDGTGKVDLDWASDKFVKRIEGGTVGKTIDPAEVAARIHYDMVMDPRNGYSQNPRWGGDHPDGVKHLSIDGRDYEYPLGSMDCSSSDITAWRQALRYTPYEGALGTGPYDGATCTSDMREAFTKTGLFRASMSPAKRGDLYLSDGHHTAMCQDGGGDGAFGYDCLSEFNRNEYGTATGGHVGDQDEGESVLRGYYDYPWKTVLHYVGGPLPATDDAGGDEAEEVTYMRPVFMTFDGDPTEHLFNPWAGTLRAVANADEKKALIRVYEVAGVEIDPKPTALGSQDSPWGARANDALSRGANFREFERFTKHPSTRAVIRDEIERALAKTPIAKLVKGDENGVD